MVLDFFTDVLLPTFSSIFVFSISTVHILVDKCMPMSGFKPRISGFEIDGGTICATSRNQIDADFFKLINVRTKSLLTPKLSLGMKEI